MPEPPPSVALVNCVLTDTPSEVPERRHTWTASFWPLRTVVVATSVEVIEAEPLSRWPVVRSAMPRSQSLVDDPLVLTVRYPSAGAVSARLQGGRASHGSDRTRPAVCFITGKPELLRGQQPRLRGEGRRRGGRNRGDQPADH